MSNDKGSGVVDLSGTSLKFPEGMRELDVSDGQAVAAKAVWSCTIFNGCLVTCVDKCAAMCAERCQQSCAQSCQSASCSDGCENVCKNSCTDSCRDSCKESEA